MRAEFLRQVEVTDDCWTWRGTDGPDAQRNAFAMFRAHEYDPRKEVEPECGNDRCVRVSHLRQEGMGDLV